MSENAETGSYRTTGGTFCNDRFFRGGKVTAFGHSENGFVDPYPANFLPKLAESIQERAWMLIPGREPANFVFMLAARSPEINIQARSKKTHLQIFVGKGGRLSTDKTNCPEVALPSGQFSTVAVISP